MHSNISFLSVAFHQVFAQYLETEFCSFWLFLCGWVTYL